MTLPIEQKKNHWEPVEWHPFYEQIVLELCAGAKNIELARKYGMTAQQICNINRTRQAKEVKDRVLAEIQSGYKTNINDRLAAIKEKAIKHIEDILDNEQLAIDKPLAVADRAIKLLEGTNVLKPHPSTIVQNNTQTNIIAPEVLEKFTAALESASEVKALHSGGSGGEFTEGSRESTKTVRIADGTAVEVGVR